MTRDDAGVVSELLNRGFDPNTLNEKGEPPLVTALRDGKWAVAEALWRHADLDADKPNLSNETPLMMACLRGQISWIRRLLDRGVPVNRSGWSPILYAATGGDLESMKLLVARGADIRSRNPSGSTPLIMAARFGSEEVVRFLVSLGADPLEMNPAGQNAIEAARWGGRPYLADLLQRLAAAQSAPATTR